MNVFEQNAAMRAALDKIYHLRQIDWEQTRVCGIINQCILAIGAPAAAPQVVADDGLVPLSVDGKSVWLEGIGAVALDYSSVKSLSDIQDAAALAQGDAAITDTSLVDLCEFMNAASISNIPILLSAQSAGALVKAMTTSAPVQPVAVPDVWTCTRMHDMGTIKDAKGDFIAQCYYQVMKTLTDRHNAAIAAPAAQGDAKELKEDEIVQVLHLQGVDTNPSKYGFGVEQVSAMSVTTLRQVLAAIAAKAAS